MILRNREVGFTLVELMISLALGIVLSLGVVQVMVSNRVTNEFNQTLADVQESGRFIVTRLKNELLEVGLYDTVAAIPVAEASVDLVAEELFVATNPVALVNQFAAAPGVASINGASGANDQLAVNLQSFQDCTGSNYGYPVGQQFHVVNHYYVENEQLICQGYNGRALRNISPSATTSGNVILMDGVKSFQLQYGLAAPMSPDNTGAVVQYVTADQLAVAQANGQIVVSIRIGMLLQSDGSISSVEEKTYTVFEATGLKVDERHYGQVFTSTVALRNTKNYVRGM